jgi:enoyl-CoA hydratase/carnithine racemase
MYDNLRVDITDRVARLVLARPEQRNRLSRRMLEEVVEACARLAEEPDVRVVVVAAEGRDFSTGVDLTDPGMRAIAAENIGRRRALLQLGPRVVRAVRELPQITIAAMHGYCLGGGGCIALACDLRVAAADLRFGMPEVQRGMTMSWRTVPLMVAHFGPARTKELLVAGKMLDADTAIAWGLANRRCDAGERAARAAAEEWATDIARETPPIQAAMVKQAVDAVVDVILPLVHMDTDQFILSQMTDDFREAVTAFLEKRRPNYEGR